LSSTEILYASFFCNGIRETLLSLLHIGQIPTRPARYS
jgi:hypothetical protein